MSGTTIDALLSFTPTAMKNLLDRMSAGEKLPLEESPAIGQQMIRINDVTDFLTKIQGFLKENLSKIEGTISLFWGNLRFLDQQAENNASLSRREITRFVFGSHPTADPIELPAPLKQVSEKIFPYYFPIWDIDHH